MTLSDTYKYTGQREPDQQSPCCIPCSDTLGGCVVVSKFPYFCTPLCKCVRKTQRCVYDWEDRCGVHGFCQVGHVLTQQPSGAGDMDQLDRMSVIAAVRDFSVRVIISTDLVARGLDLGAALLV